MATWTAVIAAAGLFLLSPTRTVANRCGLTMPGPDGRGQNVNLASYVLCRYTVERQRHGYATTVDMTVTVRKSMKGWEIHLQFATKTGVNVKSIKGGQLVGKNGSFVVRNLGRRLKAFDSFRVSLTLRHGQSNVRLFPATFLLQQPKQRLAHGMCNSSGIRPSRSEFITLENSKYRLTLSYAFSFNHRHWMSCQLEFDVPIRVTVVRNAELLGQINDRNYVIELVPPTAVIEYQKLAFNGTRTAFIKSLCYPCRWHPSVGQLIIPTPRPHAGEDGMCAGTKIYSPSSSCKKRSKSQYRMMLNFNVDRGTIASQWTTCILTFKVPVRFLAVRHAEFVKRVVNKQFIIARNGNVPSRPAIDYEILSSRAKKDGYSHAVCRTCHWDRQSDRSIITSLELPIVGSKDGRTTNTPLLPTTTRETRLPISVFAVPTEATSTQHAKPSDLNLSRIAASKKTTAGSLKCLLKPSKLLLQSLIQSHLQLTVFRLTGANLPLKIAQSRDFFRRAGKSMFALADKDSDEMLSSREITQYVCNLSERGFVCASVFADRCSGKEPVTQEVWLRCLGVK